MSDEKKSRPKRPPKFVEPTERWLRDQALRYLNRFPATRRKMTRHLMTKAGPHAAHFSMDKAMLSADIEKVVASLVKAGFINDSEFAASKARLLLRDGRSVAQIGNRLREMEFTETDRERAVAELGEDQRALDLKSAARYVKRRRFGPYRKGATQRNQRDKEMASLARQGFSYDVAARVVDADSIVEIEQLIFGPEGGSNN
jgi:regulatory protein|tara:strand:- start:225 stop:827 length:603 start_codon:yes stop_codon:yes gene_type:complete